LGEIFSPNAHKPELAPEAQQQREEQDEQQQEDRRDRDTASTPDVATSVRIANAARG
jgi:hypothetical protein